MKSLNYSQKNPPRDIFFIKKILMKMFTCLKHTQANTTCQNTAKEAEKVRPAGKIDGCQSSKIGVFPWVVIYLRSGNRCM